MSTVTPPDGAAADRITVAVDLLPAVIVDGLNASDLTVTAADPVTVNEAELVVVPAGSVIEILPDFAP